MLFQVLHVYCMGPTPGQKRLLLARRSSKLIKKMGLQPLHRLPAQHLGQSHNHYQQAQPATNQYLWQRMNQLLLRLKAPVKLWLSPCATWTFKCKTWQALLLAASRLAKSYWECYHWSAKHTPKKLGALRHNTILINHLMPQRWCMVPQKELSAQLMPTILNLYLIRLKPMLQPRWRQQTNQQHSQICPQSQPVLHKNLFNQENIA